MKWFILNRLMQAGIVLLAVTTIIFVLSRFLADPAVALLPEDALEEDYLRLRQELGLDRPFWVQYGLYMGALFRGDLGESVRSVGYDVAELIPRPLTNSAKLAGVAWIGAMLAGVTLGIIAALNRGTIIDSFARVIAVLGLVTPPWWLGIIFIIIFAVKLQWLPAAGLGGWKHYVMPAGVLALVALAGLTRLTRASMLEILDSEYVKLARAKGLPYRTVVWKHALRNALIPIVTFAGLYFALLMTGAITIELVFAWPGLGRLMINALNSQDYVVVQGTIMVAAFIVVGFNTLVDILYGVIDPRIRVS
jgi:peptide/nickel transport system permease protein